MYCHLFVRDAIYTSAGRSHNVAHQRLMSVGYIYTYGVSNLMHGYSMISDVLCLMSILWLHYGITGCALFTQSQLVCGLIAWYFLPLSVFLALSMLRAYTPLF